MAELQSRHKLLPVYQGHIDPGTCSVRMVKAVKIAAGDRQKPAAFGQSQ